MSVWGVWKTLTSDCSIPWQRTRTTQRPVHPRRPPWSICWCLWLMTEDFTASACACIQSQLVNNYGGRCAEDVILSSFPLSFFSVLFNPFLGPLFFLSSLMALWDRHSRLVAQTVQLLTRCLSNSGRDRAKKVKENKLGPVFSVEYFLSNTSSTAVPNLFFFKHTGYAHLFRNIGSVKNTHLYFSVQKTVTMISVSQRTCNTVICSLKNVFFIM